MDEPESAVSNAGRTWGGVEHRCALISGLRGMDGRRDRFPLGNLHTLFSVETRQEPLSRVTLPSRRWMALEGEEAGGQSSSVYPASLSESPLTQGVGTSVLNYSSGVAAPDVPGGWSCSWRLGWERVPQSLSDLEVGPWETGQELRCGERWFSG